MDAAGRSFFGFDEVGSRIWELLGRPCSVAELVVVLASEYDAPDSQLRTDTARFLEGLCEAQLVLRVVDRR